MTEDHSTSGDAERDGDEPRFSFTDKRKVDADGTVRPTDPDPQGDAPETVDPIDAEAAKLFDEAQAGESAPSAEVEELRAQVAELTEQLKRDQAEYVNSRRRIENSSKVAQQAAVGRVLSSLVGVLDDIELGRQHGDIVEGTPFQAISQKLEDALRGQGLERYGEVGEEFDPQLHEALMHEEADDVDVPTISVVMQPGYRMNDTVLRPARVGTRGPA